MNMSDGINFLCTKETLETFVDMEFPPDTYNFADVSVDLIDLPLWLRIVGEEKDWVLSFYYRFVDWDYPAYTGDSPAYIYTVNKKTGKGEGRIEDKQLLADLDTYFHAMRNLALYAGENSLNFDTGHEVFDGFRASSVLLRVDDGKITCELLSMTDRPDIMCRGYGCGPNGFMTRPEGWRYVENVWGYSDDPL